ncbi:DUF6963 family protein [Labrys sp. ZIDIC5]|uniref:DUF6963 family protein n=1 Tax=Labrys sedimenti TaxID=3106036 RepID=UPI002ACAE75F|nr:hypothetical protein [Labrys sp. ZIDIC5]MDZ5453142.1 hypothetical protein [Labrys sp. ZIDIC5]
MTIGIAAFGAEAGRAVWAAWAEAERLGKGDLHGFAVFYALAPDGEPVGLECQRGGLETIRAQWSTRPDLAWMMASPLAAVITSGPDRPEPLTQFLVVSRRGFVTGHRLPNIAGASDVPVNREALSLIERGVHPDEAVRMVLQANPRVDAGLIAVTPHAIGLEDSERVRERTDRGRAHVLATDGRYGLALLHNSIEPAEGLAESAARRAAAVLAGYES